MKSLNKRILVFLIYIILFLSPVYSSAIQFSNIYNASSYNQILNIYYNKASTQKNIDFTYTINNQGEVITKKIIYKDIIVGEISGLAPQVINSNPALNILANLKSVYFLKMEYSNSNKEAVEQLRRYYGSVSFEGPHNINNKDIVINNFLLPITKEKIIEYLEKQGIRNSEDVFNTLVNEKILLELPLILEIESEIIGKPEDFSNNFTITIKFTPEFASSLKPIMGLVKFVKEPILITPEYSLTDLGCKNNPTADFCYITTNDILLPDGLEYTTPEIMERDKAIRNLLDNFTVISNFKDMSFENIDLKELLVDLSLKREQFCFREGTEEYTDTIFRVAKAYNLSLEQTFQLWAIISERSNCNYSLNKNLYGFSLLDLSGRDSGNLINIEDPLSNGISKNLPLQLAEEEQFQYLALGDFKEINDYLLNNVYAGNKSKFYNLGHNGIINNDNGYFGFLINAIKNNKDDYGSTILFVSDYLKELNYLVKNSRDKSPNPFVFQDNIIENTNNINLLYVLSTVINKRDITKKEEIYSIDNSPNILKIDNFFIKENNYIKTTKEVRVLLNYLAIKRKYMKDNQYFLKYNLNTNLTPEKLNAYERLDYKYWDTKKEIYLKTLQDNGIKLMLKKNVGYYNYDNLIKIKGTPNYCARYVQDLGQFVYLDGTTNYSSPGANAWQYDTKAAAIDNYNLIWEADGVCNNKTKCSSVPTSRECCYENRNIQESHTYTDQRLFVDGAILGIYNSGSKYNGKNIEYTHVIMHIGKTIYGTPLIAESISNGQSITLMHKNLRNRIKRIYVPKTTNIKNIKDISQINFNYPPTYVIMSNKKLADLINKKKSKGDYEYLYEDPNLPGELDELEIVSENSETIENNDDN